jgi:trehalose 6-phosphate synthase
MRLRNGPCRTALPTSRLDLSREDHREYYNGFTNRVLWPILYYRIDLAEFSRRDLSGYLRVNDHFARELHEVQSDDKLRQ